MIDWLLNDILWGWGRKRAYVLTEFSWRQGWVIAMPLTRLFQEVVGTSTVVHINFQEAFGNYTGQNTPSLFWIKLESKLLVTL